MQAPRMLNPDDVKLERDVQQSMHLRVGRNEHYSPVKLKLAFPLTDPEHYIIFEDEDGGFIAILEDYSNLDSQSRQIVEEELEKSYFIPKIVRICDIDEEFRIMHWRVETERGVRSFEVKSRRRDIRWLDDRHVIIRDADGDKYEIPDYYQLDSQSKELFELEV